MHQRKEQAQTFTVNNLDKTRKFNEELQTFMAAVLDRKRHGVKREVYDNLPPIDDLNDKDPIVAKLDLEAYPKGDPLPKRYPNPPVTLPSSMVDSYIRASIDDGLPKGQHIEYRILTTETGQYLVRCLFQTEMSP